MAARLGQSRKNPDFALCNSAWIGAGWSANASSRQQGEGNRGRQPAAHRKMLGALGTFYLFTAQMVAQKVQCSCRLKGSKCCQRAQLLPGWGSYIGATPIVNTPVGCALYAKASHAAPSVHPCVCMWECAWVLIVCLPAMCGSSWRRNQFALPVNCVKKWKGFYLFCSFLK